jgi:hypothetical protein
MTVSPGWRIPPFIEDGSFFESHNSGSFAI